MEALMERNPDSIIRAMELLREDEERFDIRRISDIDYIRKKYIETANIEKIRADGLYEILFFTNLSEDEVKSFCGIFGYDVLNIEMNLDGGIARVKVKVNEEA